MYKKLNIKIIIYQIILFIALCGGINWLAIGTYNVNIIKTIIPNKTIESAIYILVGICSVTLLFKKYMFLPFLYETVYPKPLNEIKNNGTDTITINCCPNTKVIYWAALASDKNAPDPDIAYSDYSNYGIGTTDNKGMLTINFYKPMRYSVYSKGLLPAHIHYRYWKTNNMLSKVYTINL